MNRRGTTARRLPVALPPPHHPHLEPRQPARLSVAVLAGGDSSERAISLESGASVAAALAERGHRVVKIDPAEIDLAGYDWTGIDVAFIALHGRFGEDGRVQTLLEAAGIPYTGSDP